MEENKEMWKCPKCETLNQGNRCIVCGEEKPTEINIGITNHIDDKETIKTVESMTVEAHDENTDLYNEEPDVPNKNRAIAITILAAILIMTVTVFFAAIGFDYHKAVIFNTGL